MTRMSTTRFVATAAGLAGAALTRSQITAITVGKRRIGPGEPCFVIAEAGSNHDGKLKQALELIDAAADAGADAVKFQLFSASGLYPANCGVVETPAGAQDFFALLRTLEMPVGWLPRLAEYATARGILLLCSAFDEAATDAVAAVGLPAFKIASPELPHLPLLRHTAQYGRPVILSTGMSTLGEVEEAVQTLRNAGAEGVALFHCVTAYPAPPEDCNLDAIALLSLSFGVPAGLSDHTLDPVAAPLVAVALGSALVEKHYTLSRSLSGPDHAFAVEPGELRTLVDELRALEQIPADDRLEAVEARLGEERVCTLRGQARKAVTPSEAALASHDRRSLHATADIAAGDRLGAQNVAILRGERNLRPGLHPRYWSVLEGVRAARNVEYGQGVTWEDVLHDQA